MTGKQHKPRRTRLRLGDVEYPYRLALDGWRRPLLNDFRYELIQLGRGDSLDHLLIHFQGAVQDTTQVPPRFGGDEHHRGEV